MAKSWLSVAVVMSSSSWVVDGPELAGGAVQSVKIACNRLIRRVLSSGFQLGWSSNAYSSRVTSLKRVDGLGWSTVTAGAFASWMSRCSANSAAVG